MISPLHGTLVWLVPFESDLQDKKNGTNYFFLSQKLTKLEHVSGFFMYKNYSIHELFKSKNSK